MKDLHGDRMEINPAIVRSLTCWKEADPVRTASGDLVEG